MKSALKTSKQLGDNLIKGYSNIRLRSCVKGRSNTNKIFLILNNKMVYRVIRFFRALNNTDVLKSYHTHNSYGQLGDLFLLRNN
jgi:hypothetical protein